MFTRFNAVLTRFNNEEKGAVAIMFGLMSVILIFAAGIAIDFNRVLDARGRIGDAADAAALAAGRAMLSGATTDDVKQTAVTYFKTNTKSVTKAALIGEPTVQVNRDAGTINIDVVAKIDMTLTRVAGLQALNVPVTTAATFKQRDIEVGMALDVTGSMKDPVGGVRKIDALKAAFKTFADKMMPEEPIAGQKVRIGLAPYSAGINLGTYANSVSAGKSKDGCVTESKGAPNSDADTDYFVKEDNSKDIDPTENYYSFVCPKPTVFPLSSDKNALLARVNDFNPDGGTAGHLGAQWAWNIISDKWNSTWGASAADSYSRVKDGKLLKAVILMTDGIFNTSFHNGKSSEQAVALCDAMKANDVVVFSVGFGLGADKTALQTLKSCASPGDDYFADASSPEELDAAFAKFAAKMTALRLTK